MTVIAVLIFAALIDLRSFKSFMKQAEHPSRVCINFWSLYVIMIHSIRNKMANELVSEWNQTREFIASLQ